MTRSLQTVSVKGTYRERVQDRTSPCQSSHAWVIPTRSTSSSPEKRTVTPWSGRRDTNSYTEGSRPLLPAQTYYPFPRGFILYLWMREELRTTNISAPEANPESRGFALHCGGFINKPVSCQRGEEGVATKHRSAAGSFVDVHSRFWITLVRWFLTIGI